MAQHRQRSRDSRLAFVPLLPTSLPDGGASRRPAASSRLRMRPSMLQEDPDPSGVVTAASATAAAGRREASASSGEIDGCPSPPGPPWRAGEVPLHGYGQQFHGSSYVLIRSNWDLAGMLLWL
uniref:Uncharacterized protein n=1 Tax=Oryza punctata TaxID=4537 RepID=A0A0E0LSJ8_ORYPU